MNTIEYLFPRSELKTRVSVCGDAGRIPLKADLILADPRVMSLHGGSLRISGEVLEIQAGETAKTPENLLSLWRSMAELDLRKDSRMAVAGGGTLCDLGALAASTWKRGVHLTLVPTTLLCMVDACMGGKTAVNLGPAKNQIGTVYPAEEIIIWPGFLGTLPTPRLREGMAEALKTAVIGDRRIADYLQEGDFTEAVLSSLRVKAAIVARDLEENGERRLLNLGHTVAHAIEAVSDHGVSHGEAVAMGIPVAARMGGYGDFAEEFTRVAASLGVSTAIPSGIDPSEVLNAMGTDKKTLADGRVWIFPRGWEDCVQQVLPPEREKELLLGALG